MGTRHLTIVQLNDEYKVAQYGQWDGYPSGQGRTVHKFLKTADLNIFREKLKNTRYADSEEMKRLWKEQVGEVPERFVSMEDAEKFAEKYPQLDRDMGAKVLEYILSSEGEVLLQNQIDFAGSSLFCEWAWLVNLDTNELEVYRGFNKKELTESDRFFSVEPEEDSEYKQIVLFHKCSISEIPDSVDEFIDLLEKKEAEEEEEVE